MIVVSDTSPLNYLILIAEIELLVELYREVIVPPAVVDELSAPGAPGKVRQWIDGTPQWLSVRPVDAVDAALTRLGLGEGEAITLASELKADLLLIDELDGRQAARACGLTVVGTLGVLAHAADRGLVDLREAIQRLLQTNFRVSSTLLESLYR